MNFNHTPIIDRLHDKLSRNDLTIVREAFFRYMLDKDPKCSNLKWRQEILDEMLPYLTELSPYLWESIKPHHMVTSYDAVHSVYDTIRF